MSANVVPDLHLVGAAAGAVNFARYRYAKNGDRVENIREWALEQFQKHYHEEKKDKSCDQ